MIHKNPPYFIIDDYVDFKTQLGEKEQCSEVLFARSCARNFGVGDKKNYVLTKEGSFVLPTLRVAMQTIIKDNTHLTERCEAMLAQLSGPLAAPLEPTYDELNPPPPPKKEYRFALGDTVYLGAQEYELLAYDNQTVRLYDPVFPIINKELPRAEFDRLLAENPLNDRLLQVVEDVSPAAEQGEPDTPQAAEHHQEERTGTPGYELGFGHLGNGVTVWNRLELQDGDYKTVAHIAPDRTVTYYEDGLPEDVRTRIEEFAATSTMTISATQDVPVFSTPPREREPASGSFWDDYNSTKERYPDSLVLYQVGDFFELYGGSAGEDAQIAASELGLALTTRTIPDIGRVSMCGFPAHALENNVVRLTAAGYDVIVASLEDNRHQITAIPAAPTERAKRLINEFYEREYNSPADFSNLRDVALAHSATGDGEHSIEVSADLTVFRLTYQVDGESVASIQCHDLDDLNGLLANLDFDEMIAFAEERYSKQQKQLHQQEQEADDFSDIDPAAIRAALAENGIVDGHVVDPDKLDANPFVQQVMADVEQIAANTPPAPERFSVIETDNGYAVWDDARNEIYVDGEGVQEEFTSEWQAEDYLKQVRKTVADKDAAEWLAVERAKQGTPKPAEKGTESLADGHGHESDGPASALPVPSAEEHRDPLAPAYQVGDTAYLDDTPFFIDEIRDSEVSLRDPTLAYPIFRSESKENFERLLRRDDRNLPITDYFPISTIGPADSGDDLREVLTGQGGLLDSAGISEVSSWLRDGLGNTEIARLLTEKYDKTDKGVTLETGKTVDYSLYNGSFSIDLRNKSNTFVMYDMRTVAGVLRSMYQQEMGGFTHEPIKAAPETEALTDGPVLAPPAPRRRAKVSPFVLHPEVPAADRHEYHITDDAIGAGTPGERFNNNVRAIRLLKKLEAEDRFATPEEQAVLAQYVGWGGLADCFDERHSKYAELKALLDEDEYAAARESTLTAFYTPPVVIRSIYQALENMGFKTGNLLEPSCGIGNFIGMRPEALADSKIYGIELDGISGRIAQQLYQKSSIAVQGFEKTDLPDSFFDAAIGNVPFGSFKVPDKRYDKHNFLIHDYFFARTLDKVRPGGIIAFITSKGTMDKETPTVRKYIAQRADLLGAIRLPNNAFKDAAGTEVTSDILFLQKRDALSSEEPSWVHLNTDENGLKINQYFIDHPEMVMGDMREVSGPYGPETACLPHEGQDLGEQLTAAIQNIQGSITEYVLDDPEAEGEDKSIPADPNVRNFSYTIVGGQVYYRENSRMNPVEVSVTAANRIKGLIGIRDCVRTLIEYQTEDWPTDDIQAQQRKLNALYIRADSLEQVVLLELNRMVSYLKNHAEEFAELLAQKTTKDYERESRNRRQHLQELIARNKEVDRLFERIYEDNVSGKLTDERFMKMSQRYDEEQQQLKKDIDELQRQCDRENDRAFCKEQFLKAVRKFMEMKTLTPTILHELVERIDVYQTQGRGKNRTQRIVIHYNFIGVLDLPEVEEYPENVVLDSRQGVAIEYLVGKAG